MECRFVYRPEVDGQRAFTVDGCLTLEAYWTHRIDGGTFARLVEFSVRPHRSKTEPYKLRVQLGSLGPNVYLQFERKGRRLFVCLAGWSQPMTPRYRVVLERHGGKNGA